MNRGPKVTSDNAGKTNRRKKSRGILRFLGWAPFSTAC